MIRDDALRSNEPFLERLAIGRYSVLVVGRNGRARQAERSEVVRDRSKGLPHPLSAFRELPHQLFDHAARRPDLNVWQFAVIGRLK